MSETILSVGIDIGTSTTQVIFSKITMRNVVGETFVPKIDIVNKEVVYQSPLYFTPLKSSTDIDSEKVRQIVRKEYDSAGFSTSDPSTGAVIITGETARKKNAEEVVRALSDMAGQFVVATAGPDLESVLSGRGSGAAKMSERYNGYVVNLDVGGGTTNISVFKDGKAVDTACFDIGGRLIKLNGSHEITYIASKMKVLAESVGLNLKIGQKIDSLDLQTLCMRMAEIIEESVGLKEESPFLSLIATNHGLKHPNLSKNAIFTFSGGVADCVYHPERFLDVQFGDIGVYLGRAIRESCFFTHDKARVPNETIRATVVGAGNHSMELSGSTITYTESDFPVMDLPVVKVKLETKADLVDFVSRLRQQIAIFENEDEIQEFAVAFKGWPCPDFYEVESMAEVLFEGLKPEIEKGICLTIVVEEDFGKALGLALRRRIREHCRLICVDSICVEEGDYIDIGLPVAGGRVLPVVVKTLVFI